MGAAAAAPYPDGIFHLHLTAGAVGSIHVGRHSLRECRHSGVMRVAENLPPAVGFKLATLPLTLPSPPAKPRLPLDPGQPLILLGRKLGKLLLQAGGDILDPDRQCRHSRTALNGVGGSVVGSVSLVLDDRQRRCACHVDDEVSEVRACSRPCIRAGTLSPQLIPATSYQLPSYTDCVPPRSSPP